MRGGPTTYASSSTQKIWVSGLYLVQDGVDGHREKPQQLVVASAAVEKPSVLVKVRRADTELRDMAGDGGGGGAWEEGLGRPLVETDEDGVMIPTEAAAQLAEQTAEGGV